MKSKPLLPEMWHKEADVVVVGYGAAGATAAITAHDAGARVLILEKAPDGEEGGNSRVAGQGWFNPTPVDRGITYFNALCGAYTVVKEMVRAWAEEMAKNTDWIKSLGGNPVETRTGPGGAEFPELPGSDCVHIYQLDGQLGYENLWKLLKASVDKRHIEVLYSTPGKELIENCPGKEILGVRAEREGSPLNIKAKRAVVLTCGGFQNNQEMIRDFLPNLPYCYPLGTPHNTGDGIKMAMTVGADLWHMNNIAGPWYSLKVPEIPAILEIVPLHYAKEFPGGMVVVGADGKRFMNEKFRNTHGKIKVAGQWTQAPAPCPMFMIFDHTLFSGGPFYDKNLYHGWNAILKVYDWSEDNSAELAKGWIKKSDTVTELAKNIGLDPAAVEDTVNKWNAYCAAGKDPEFGRTRMLSPIEHSPFYAIELSPLFFNTQGGPRRNGKGQILRPDGSPIRRLYSAGELGSIHSFLCQGGGNLGECMAFGRISGRNATTERSWE
ncbi:MAG: FAD-dependent oxidoreductase [Thermodesulfobacteriota bacterium]|nr:FAD-dependent oxidoreductase [Thermodesulfobacteriota bacterium]